MKRFLILGILAVGGLSALASGLVWGHHRSAVDWHCHRVLVLSSDDWGLCGFLPDTTVIASVDRQALAPGQIPDVYWHSTLEDSAMVAELGSVLARHRGRDGLPAVLQPNYIMASLSYHQEGPDSLPTWTEHVLPDTPPGFERPGLWTAVRNLQQAGVWHPELHGRLHYDPVLRLQRTSASVAIQQAAALQILPFPGIDTAWELGPWRDLDLIARELDQNLDQFTAAFGSPPRSVIAPDYLWEDEHENLWVDRGLRVIQGQRQQERTTWRGTQGRLQKVMHRVWTRWWRADRVYIDRNCLFEPVQQIAGQRTTPRARAEIQAAWNRGEPAVLQAHRINFVHLDPGVRALGLREVDRLLTELAPSEPLFLVDGELADLKRRGTAWALRGDQIIVRNLTRSRRLVVVPPLALAAARGRHQPGPERPDRSLVLSLAPGESRIIGAPVRPGS